MASWGQLQWRYCTWSVYFEIYHVLPSRNATFGMPPFETKQTVLLKFKSSPVHVFDMCREGPPYVAWSFSSIIVNILKSKHREPTLKHGELNYHWTNLWRVELLSRSFSTIVFDSLQRYSPQNLCRGRSNPSKSKFFCLRRQLPASCRCLINFGFTALPKKKVANLKSQT